MKKIIDYIRQFNKRTHLDESKILYLKQYYMSMYRYYMVCMYDEGYIYDPTIYDEGVIRRNLVELKIKGIADINGIYIISKDTVRYALYKNLEESQQRFLFLLLNILTYREYCFNLDEFYEVYGNSVKLQLKPFSGSVITATDVELTKAIARLYVNKDETVEWVSVDEFIRELVLKELQIENNGSFDSSLSYKNEVSLVKLLFGSHVPRDLEGTHSSKLKAWYEKNSSSLLYTVYSKYSEEILDRLAELANSYGDDTVLMYSTGIFVRKKISTIYTPINLFAIVSGYEDTFADEEQWVNGYTGEGYTQEYLDEEGFNYIGVPIKTKVDGKEIYIFDREQTDIGSTSWFKANNLDFVFNEKTDIEVTNEESAIQSSNQGILGKYKVQEV